MDLPPGTNAPTLVEIVGVVILGFLLYLLALFIDIGYSGILEGNL